MNSIYITAQSPGRKAWFILIFCCFYISLQLFLIGRSYFIPSKHFGFWMFPESTYFTASLRRVLADGEQVKTYKGAWVIETDSGDVLYKWASFVKGYRMDQLEVRLRSKGTFDDTLKYFQAALDYVADCIPEDQSTNQLVMRIKYQRAGGPPEVIVLKSKSRLEGLVDGTG